MPKFDLCQLKTLSQLDDYCRAKVLYDHCNGDIRLIQKEVKNRLGRNTKPSYQMKKIKGYLPLAQSPKSLKLENMIKLKAELKEY